jgi:transcription termination factor NusB
MINNDERIAIINKHLKNGVEIPCSDGVIIEEAVNLEDGYLDKIGCLLAALLIEHSRTMKKTETKKADFDVIKQINPALNYINSHFSEKISLSKLSELCFISEATLRRYFYEYLYRRVFFYEDVWLISKR